MADQVGEHFGELDRLLKSRPVASARWPAPQRSPSCPHRTEVSHETALHIIGRSDNAHPKLRFAKNQDGRQNLQKNHASQAKVNQIKPIGAIRIQRNGPTCVCTPINNNWSKLANMDPSCFRVSMNMNIEQNYTSQTERASKFGRINFHRSAAPKMTVDGFVSRLTFCQ